MKVLSVCQPWAWLLVNGFKDVENRSWAASYRGPLLIHAGLCKSASWKKNRFADKSALEAIFARLRKHGITPPAVPADLESGGIVGQVNLLDCARKPEGQLLPGLDGAVFGSPWFVGPVGWLVADARPLPFIPLRGRLMLFDYEGLIPTYRKP